MFAELEHFPELTLNHYLRDMSFGQDMLSRSKRFVTSSCTTRY